MIGRPDLTRGIVMMQKTKYRAIYAYKRKDGGKSYYIRPVIRGKLTWRKAGDTITEAHDLLKEYRRLKRLEGLGVNIPGRITFEKLADLYLEDYQKRRGEGNLARIRSAVKKLKGVFGSKLASGITELNIDNADLSREELIYLKAILSKGIRWKYLVELPEIKIRSPRKLNRVITDKELAMILEQASPDHKDAIILSLSLGGMRLGEITKISQGNTDFEQGTIDITERKADQPKRFILTDTAAAIIRRRFLANGGVAFNESAGKLSQRFFYERRKMKGVKPWRFHDLRHLVTTILKKENIETVREVLGHTSINTTSRYMHSQLEDQKRALLKIEKHLKAHSR